MHSQASNSYPEVHTKRIYIALFLGTHTKQGHPTQPSARF